MRSNLSVAVCDTTLSTSDDQHAILTLNTRTSLLQPPKMGWCKMICHCTTEKPINNLLTSFFDVCLAICEYLDAKSHNVQGNVGGTLSIWTASYSWQKTTKYWYLDQPVLLSTLTFVQASTVTCVFHCGIAITPPTGGRSSTTWFSARQAMHKICFYNIKSTTVASLIHSPALISLFMRLSWKAGSNHKKNMFILTGRDPPLEHLTTGLSVPTAVLLSHPSNICTSCQ